MAWSMGLSLAVQVLGTRTTGEYSETGPLPQQRLPAEGPRSESEPRESAADQTKGGSAMTNVELLVIAVVFTTGVITGIVCLVSMASRREDRRARLSREAPDSWALAGRFLTGLYVRRPGDDTPRRRPPDDDPPSSQVRAGARASDRGRRAQGRSPRRAASRARSKSPGPGDGR